MDYPSILLSQLVLCCLLFHLPLHHALSFNFSNFTDSRLIFNGTAAIQNGILSLTSDRNNDTAAGRAVYSQQLHLYDPITGNSTDFTTHFSFKISTVTSPGQDGLAFFLAPNGSLLPEYASGGCLALFSQCDNFTIPRRDMVAVEFDTYGNTWDETDKEHVGININSIKSDRKQDLSRSMKNGVIVDAIIRYDSKANDLSVSWSFPGDPFVSLSHRVNLTSLLPEWVSIGFAAGSAYFFETHEILSWEFTTELSPAVPGSTLSFNFNNFADSRQLILNGTAAIQNGSLSLTSNPNNNTAAGRAVYSEQLHLYDPITGNSTDFTTHFSFKISTVTSPGQDGLAFFLAPNGSLLPEYASGGCLALFSQCDNFTIPRKDMVAIEFDTYGNTWDETDKEHVGININSIKSDRKQDLSRSMKNGVIVDAIIRYDSKANDLSVSWSFPSDPFVSLSHRVNLTSLLPEWVSIGFAAGSAYFFETHEILSWEFTTELSPAVPGSTSTTFSAGIIVGCVVGGLFLVCGIVSVLVFCWRKRSRGKGKEGEKNGDFMEQEIENTGPKKFSYNDLVRATNNFAEQGKLGEGGFGGVYKGFLSELQQFVAVKKVSRPSDQGKKAYTTEIKIISILRHKNMVQLIGWCHENSALLLVYEFMPNGSLDFHLFGGRTQLKWEVRHKIVLGLASALLYLHEESGQYVVHRDIKSSNIMLDSDFNAKLGDFGLARLMDEEAGVKTTGLAGTWGYIAPEYASTGKATKGSDVFSFGIVALEIACGKRSTEAEYEGPHVPIAGWVWDSYGNERLHEVVDKTLLEFDMKEMECLLIVGLWCAHPDPSLRPSIRQALQVLNFDAPLPNLPKKMPVANYNVPATAAASHSGSTDSAPTMSLSSINLGR